MTAPDDARLKQEFETLRDDDRRMAPDFGHTVSAAGLRAVAAGRWRSRNRIVFAGALLFAAVIGTTLVGRLHQSPAPPARQPELLLEWSSPTAFLLETPGKRFSNEIPPLGNREIYGLPGGRKEIK